MADESSVIAELFYYARNPLYKAAPVVVAHGGRARGGIEIPVLQRGTGVFAIPDEIVPPPPERVKCYLGLFTASRKRQLDGYFRLWLILRALDPAGSGWVPIAQLQELITSAQLGGFSNLRRILYSPQAVQFWHVERWACGPVILYRSLWRVGVGLSSGVFNPFRGKVAWLWLADMATLKQFRAASYNAILASKEGQPISRGVLRSLAGVRSTATLTEYEGMQFVERVKNHVNTHIPYPHDPGELPSLDRRCFPLATKEGWMIGISMPNSYKASADFAKPGQLKKLRRKFGAPQIRGVADENRPVRRYFDDVDAAYKARRRGAPGALVRAGSYAGRADVQEWRLLEGDRCTKIEGTLYPISSPDERARSPPR